MSAVPGIAVVGMAGRFPGAPSLEQFWDNLRQGVESIAAFSPSELERAGVPADMLARPNYVRAGTVLEGADLFDADFFGYHRREAEVLDPQQRVFLECAYHALEDAGYDPDRYQGAIGVFAGTALNTYLLNNLLSERATLEKLGRFQAMLGCEKDYVSTRVAYELNLRGPALTVQTACSTSLVAIHVACQNLWTFQCDMALAGGVAIHAPQTAGYLHQDGMILSPDGHCRTFDAAAQGTVGGTGVGIVVLKRLEDALRDRDAIHAVIRGSAINNDGSAKVGFTAPSVQGQAEVIALAQAMADVDASTIDYVEAHGTATPLGDPIEVAALTQAFRATTNDTHYCALGSVKSNMGHADAAAGVAGFIKTVLALEHREIPPSLHFDTPNPAIDFAGSPFFVNTTLAPWPVRAHPRRAGVSSFGIGGTNAHVVLEEAPDTEVLSSTRSAHLLVLSARTASALNETTQNLVRHLHRHPDATLADVAFTLQTGRRAFDHRRALACRSVSEAVERLQRPDTRLDADLQGRDAEPASVVFMFPGGGAQYPGMASDLYREESRFRREIDRGLEILARHVPDDLRSVLLAPADGAARAMERPSTGLPLLFLTEYALARLLMAWGSRPQAMIGHSLGEYTAACLAGVLSFEDALAIVALRGRLFERLPEGAMLSVPLGESDVRPLLEGALSIAAVNGRQMVVVSGPLEEVAALDRRLQQRGIESVRVHVSVAAHSTLVDAIVDEFEQFVRSCPLSPPSMPYVSNVTGTWITAEEATSPRYWARHLRQTVRFADGAELLGAQAGRVYVEVGPGRTLGNLVRQHSPAGVPEVLPTLRHPRDEQHDTAFLLTTLGRLWTLGVTPNWDDFHAESPRRRVPLPAYPFERQRYWIEPGRPDEHDATAVAERATVGEENAPRPRLNEDSFESAQSAMSEPTTMQSGSPRRDAILAKLTDVLHDMSGIPAAELPADATFLELGFDSLFLTQLTQAYRQAFHVPLKFRHLLEEVTTLGKLADHLVHTLPPDAYAAPTPAVPQRVAAALPSAPLAPGTAALPAQERPPVAGGQSSGGAVEALIRQQLDIMSQQLAVLSGASAPASSAVAPSPAAIASPANRPEPVMESAAPSAPRRFGPYEAIERRTAPSLTPRQQAHLDALIDRYTKRTAGSKRLTQNHRGVLADPRAVTGFRPQWKEMIYQIAMVRSAGSRMWDVDGHEYVDFTMGFGVNLFGHSPAFVNDAVERQLRAGVELGVLSPLAGEVAERLCQMTGHNRATFANTGSDAILGALRAARTVTGRDRVAMFTGGYHGMNDEVMVKSIGSKHGPRRSVPAAAGIPRHAVESVLVLDYDDPACLDTLEAHVGELAAVLVEPIQSRRPSLQPRDLLHAIRAVTKRAGTALVFDELITGFRLHPGGAQAWFDIKADLATYGKVLSGGVPMAAIAGSSAFMDAFDGGPWSFGDESSPEADVTFYGSTFTRHPLGLASALSVLQHLQAAGPQLQESLNRRTEEMVGRLSELFARFGAPIRVEYCGSLFQIKYPDDHNNPFAQTSSFERLLPYYLRLKGVHLWDRAAFLSTAHTDADIEFFLKSVEDALADMRAGGFFPDGPAGGSGTARSDDDRQAPAAMLVGAATGPARALGPFSLTEGQSEIWLAAQMNRAASAAYNEAAVLRLQGPLDRSALERAVKTLVDRHDALRTTFAADGSAQAVADRVDVPVRTFDVSEESAADREAKAHAIVSSECAASFDLERGPLVRFSLVRVRDAEHWLVFSVHHIMCDGASVGVLLEELAACYSALRGGRSPSLPEVSPFREFAAAEADHRLSEAGREQEEFWLTHLAGDLPILGLPADRPRPAGRTYLGAQERRRIDPSLHAELKRFGARHGCTMVATLLASFQVLLHRLSGQSDVIVGLPAAVQVASGKRVVGHGTNLLPLRSVLTPTAPFVDFLRRTRGTLLDAYEHQHCTFGSLIQRLSVPRQPGVPPLVQALFNVDRAEALTFEGLDVRSGLVPRQHYNFDIGFNCVESSEGLLIQCNYQPDLFDDTTIRRWLGHFETLLEAIVRDPAQTVATLPLLSPAERTTLLEAWNDTTRDWPPALLHSAVEAQAALTPAATAVVSPTACLTYAELDARANQLARQLHAGGLGPHARVGVCLDRSPAMVVALLGVLKAGAAYVPLDPGYPAARLSAILADAGLAMAIVERATASRLPAEATPRFCLDTEADAIARQAATPPDCTATPDSLAYVLYTSGSTGRPKGVEIEHRAVVNLLNAMRHEPGLSSADVLLAVTTISFDIAALELFLPITTGATVVIAPREAVGDAGLLRSALQRSGATVVQATPVTWRLLLEAGWPGDPRLKILCGGEALSPDLAEQLATRCAELWNMYGPTETTIWSTCRRITDGRDVDIGRPIANTEVLLLDDERQLVPIGVAGELCIGGDGLARGYLNRPDLTEERFLPHPFKPGRKLYRTGDRVRWRAGGTIEFLGRADRQVKVRGFRAELGEIEGTLESHPAVREAVVLLREDVPGDPRLVAYVLGTGVSEADLRGHVRRSLPDALVPSAYVSVEAWPLTPNGKLDRARLPAPGRTEGPELDEPRTATEAALAALWSDLLGRARVGIREDFFEAGGHSLLAVRLFGRIEQQLGVRLPLSTLFEHPTIEDLARLLQRQHAGPSGACVVSMRPAAGRVPVYLLGGIGGEVLSYGSLATHLGRTFGVYGLEPPAGLLTEGVTVESIARRYLEEVMALHPSGPVSLGGFCAGGTFAFELAHQLRAVGRDVPLLVMIDHELTATDDDTPSLVHGTLNFARNVPRWVRDDLLASDGHELANRVRSWSRLARTRLPRRKADAAASRPDVRDVLGMWRFPAEEVPQMERLFAAVQRYQPRAYDGRILVVRPETLPLLRPSARGARGWEQLATGPFDVEVVRGSHSTILREPFVTALAATLERHLADAAAPVPHGSTRQGAGGVPADRTPLTRCG